MRLRPTRNGLTICPVSRLTRWICARRRAATHNADGLTVSDPIPYGYSTLASVLPVLGSSLSSVSGAPLPGTSATQTAFLDAATAPGGPGTLIGFPRGRPVR